MADYEALTALIDVAGLKKEGKVSNNELEIVVLVIILLHASAIDNTGGYKVRWFCNMIFHVI